MGAIGRARVETQLAWEHSVPHLLACYAKVLGQERAVVRAPGLESSANSEP